MEFPELKLALTKYTRREQDQIFFYWKGRVALYAFFKAMGVKPGDEIILPAYTCVVVPNAILYLGAKPVYVDVSSRTYNMDVSQVEAAITDRTKAIICQNTYGLSSDLEILVDIAKQYNLYTIEDCTHGFGGTYEDQANGSFCDAAFFSTQWNKPFSTGVGGFAVTHRADLAEKLQALEQELIQPSFKDVANLKLMYWVRRYLLTPRTYWTLVKIYRFLSKHNIVVGSSSGEEITSTDMPSGYFKAFSEAQAKEGMKNLAKLPEVLKLRKSNASLYSAFLKKHSKTSVDEALVSNHSFLKYPLLVKDRAEFMRLAEQAQVELGDWFTSPLHPIEGDLSAWNFDSARYPVASYLAKHVVNLPTSPRNISRIYKFIECNIDHII